VSRVLSAVAGLPRSGPGAAAIVAFAACLLGLLHWGLGLVGGALVAREVGIRGAARGIRLHYPLIGAAGYTGLMVWGGGLSGSIPLKAIEYRPPAQLAGPFPFEAGIPKEVTLWSTLNLTVCAVLLLLVPLLAWLLHPRNDDACTPCHLAPGEGRDDADPEPAAGRSPVVTWLEAGRLPALVVSGMGLAALALEAARGTFRLDINSLNFTFLFLGILAQGSLVRYARAVTDGVVGAAGIVLQFPFYFGILGILLATGLAAQVSRGIAAVSTEATFPVLTFLSAGLVNLFVPSGGGQWIIQGDIVISGAGVDPGQIGESVMALAYGDGWTNMLQPFWALPLLGITGLRARDIIGYTAAIMLVSGGAIIACLLVL
jgi:short-chain fatty acids transporter